MSPADYRTLRNNSWEQEPVSDPEARERILEDRIRQDEKRQRQLSCTHSQDNQEWEKEDLSRITDMAVRF